MLLSIQKAVLVRKGMKFLYRYEALVILTPIIRTSIHSDDNLSLRILYVFMSVVVEVENSKLCLVDCRHVCACVTYSIRDDKRITERPLLVLYPVLSFTLYRETHPSWLQFAVYAGRPAFAPAACDSH